VFGTLKFAANETQKTIDIPINLDAYIEGPENFTVKLSNPTGGAALIAPSSALVTINDSASPTPNAIDDTADFVRQQYHDFLNRDADPRAWLSGRTISTSATIRPNDRRDKLWRSVSKCSGY
jgi:hypothetical protein